MSDVATGDREFVNGISMAPRGAKWEVATHSGDSGALRGPHPEDFCRPHHLSFALAHDVISDTAQRIYRTEPQEY